MKRISGFQRDENGEDKWITVKVKMRPALVSALKNEATRESQALNRRVYLSDLVRDGVRLLFQARRIDPYGGRRRFVPSPQSEGATSDDE